MVGSKVDVWAASLVGWTVRWLEYKLVHLSVAWKDFLKACEMADICWAARWDSQSAAMKARQSVSEWVKSLAKQSVSERDRVSA